MYYTRGYIIIIFFYFFFLLILNIGNYGHYVEGVTDLRLVEEHVYVGRGFVTKNPGG